MSFGEGRRRAWLVAMVLAAGSVMGVYNISSQWVRRASVMIINYYILYYFRNIATNPPPPQGIQGEFNSPDQESLVHWINETTPPSAVFAGAMPTMTTIKLTTHRPIVNHPHYEDAKLR